MSICLKASKTLLNWSQKSHHRDRDHGEQDSRRILTLEGKNLWMIHGYRKVDLTNEAPTGTKCGRNFELVWICQFFEADFDLWLLRQLYFTGIKKIHKRHKYNFN